MKTRNIIIMTMCSLFLMTSCYEDGIEGPVGDVGEQGLQGPKGDKGPTGEDASEEVLEEFRSEWISNEFSGSDREWTSELNAPEITDEVLERGVITVFYFLNGTYIYKLPYEATYGSTNKVTYELAPGKLIINSTVKLNPESVKFRYVIYMNNN